MQQDDIDSANDIKIDKYDISNKNSSLKIDLNEKKDNNNNFEDIIVSNKVKKDKKIYLTIFLTFITLFLVVIFIYRLIENRDYHNEHNFVHNSKKVKEEKKYNTSSLENSYKKSIIESKLKPSQNELKTKKIENNIANLQKDNNLENIKNSLDDEVITEKIEDNMVTLEKNKKVKNVKNIVNEQVVNKKISNTINKDKKSIKTNNNLNQIDKNKISSNELQNSEFLEKDTKTNKISQPTKYKGNAIVSHKIEIINFDKEQHIKNLSSFDTNIYKNRYFIQIGAFKKSPSKKYLDSLKSLGYNYILKYEKSENILYKKLLIGPYIKKEDALNEIKTIRAKFKISNVFIRKFNLD
jgi:cell division septation protein DedD